MAKEPARPTVHLKDEPKEEKKKERRHYPQWEHKITSGFASLDQMGDEGWEYQDMWDPDHTVTTHNGVARFGVEPFFIWRREKD